MRERVARVRRHAASRARARPRVRGPGGAPYDELIRVLIADDQPLMRTGFKTVLEATGMIEVVAEADDGEEAIARRRAAPART